jgi:exosortase A
MATLETLPRLPRLAPLHLPQAWRMPLLRLALAWVGLFALHLGDWAAMAAQWWDSSTYNHILLIPAIVGWMVWQRAPQIGQLVPQGWWPGLLALAGALFLWLLGSVSGVNLASQLGAVLALQAAVLALLGPRVAIALLFPLAYMLFLVPFGDELVPPLQMITADITIALTHWSGIQAEIDGVFINTPAGLFEVAEACSGVKFLIAMIALGTLVAHVCFRSWTRRALFMAVAVILPIVANGIRAWGTVYIAQSQGVAFAAGFDHIFYGWVFFALVMGLLLAIGWRFFDRSPDEAFVDPQAIDRLPLLAAAERLALPGWWALAGVALLAMGSIGWAVQAHRLEAPVPDTIALPQVPGWQRVDHAPDIWWEPRASGADHRLLGSYADAQGRRVEVFFGFYAAQAEGREPSAFGQGALVPGTDWRWLKPAPPIGSGHAEWLQALGEHDRLAVTFYRSGDLLTGSAVQLKLAAMRDRLLLRRVPAAVLIVSAEEHGADPEPAVADFLAAAGPVDAWMDRVARVP